MTIARDNPGPRDEGLSLRQRVLIGSALLVAVAILAVLTHDIGTVVGFTVAALAVIHWIFTGKVLPPPG